MKKRCIVAAGLIALLVPTGVALARPVTDCPLRNAPFSIESPIIDILLSSPAKALLDTEAPEILTALPQGFLTTRTPSFAAILTPRAARRMTGTTAARLDRLDAKLRAVPVTAADKRARCARYDNDRPAFTLPTGKPRLLLFEKITGFRDGPSVNAARAAFQAIARRKGWAIVVSDKGGTVTPAMLRRFDAVIWNNISGDVLTLSQREALRSYVEGGGGFVAVHGSAGDPSTFWDWYSDGLIGARFAGHPMNPQFQDARIVKAQGEHPVAAGLPAEWRMTDEWYSFTTNPRSTGSSVIATLDERSYAPGGLAMGDHPIAWTRCVGKGRAFYSAIGHRPETYADPHYGTMLDNALAWAIAGHGACSPAAPASR